MDGGSSSSDGINPSSEPAVNPTESIPDPKTPPKSNAWQRTFPFVAPSQAGFKLFPPMSDKAAEKLIVIGSKRQKEATGLAIKLPKSQHLKGAANWTTWTTTVKAILKSHG